MYSAPPHLSIIIPVFNQWPLTEQCLRSLMEHTPGRFFEVIVVDNASTDETPAQCPLLGHSLFGDRFAYYPQPENLGFGPACNLGGSYAQGEILFFLNNDTQFTPNWFNPLLQTLRSDPRLGAVGPLLIYPGSERVQHMGIVFWPNTTEHLYELFPRNHPLAAKVRHVQALTGAALMLSRSLFRGCEGFYPGYRNGFEDLELCARIRGQGLRLRCVPQSVVFHLASQTPGRFDHDQANAKLLHQRCPGSFRPDALRVAKRDGYAVRLTPWLVPFMALPEERTQALAPLARAARDDDRIRRMLDLEPLWSDGYAALADHLEAAHGWKEAADVRILQNHFAPSLDGYQKLLNCARALGDQGLIQETAAALDNIAQRMRNVDDLMARARSARRQCEDMEEPELAGVYKKWLEAQRRYYSADARTH